MSSSRYSRQINLIGEASQKKLAESSVIVVGAGGIGAPCLLYLTAGGVGSIGFIDHDVVSLSNLHRQILYKESNLGRPKSTVAYQHLTSVNSEIKLHEHHLKLNHENAAELLSKYDLVIDASDNFKTRYLINDICCQLNKPFISSSIFQNKIQIMMLDIRHGCYRCAFPEPPPPFLMNNCSEAGVLGAAVGIAGTITATLTMNYLIHSDALTAQSIYTYNCDTLQSEQFPFSKNENCPACSLKLISWPGKSFDLELKDIELSKYVIIDIRECDEDRSITLTPKDIHIPFSQLMDHPNNIPNSKLLVYCKTGQRSDFAAHMLQKNGHEAFSLKNGVGFQALIN